MTSTPSPLPLAPPDVAASFDARLLTGIALWMQDQGLGAWRGPGGLEAPPGVPVIVAAGMSDDFSLVYSLDTYAVDDGAGDMNDSTVGLQVMCRADVDDDRRMTLAMADQLFDRLQSSTDLRLRPDPDDESRDVWVVLARRQSGASLGRDEHGRWQRTQNYYLDVSRPTTNRPD